MNALIGIEAFKRKAIAQKRKSIVISEIVKRVSTQIALQNISRDIPLILTRRKCRLLR